ncbi:MULTISPECIES: hypothetical protein [Shewanella]|uniref:Uncharacterized protein n=1 Tax=Shewanella salipaludis TaxID=2723052 RepID=A0A972JKB5_9GAMM|nr:MULTISPECIES: hypothetical protein [Shewanella]MCE9685477.1 hypothetical protein [Shewanella sp. AS16]NMH64944.1 hypothetical protein [Shewanella salipaludis]
MPVNLDDLDIDKAIADSAAKADAKLAPQITSLTGMTDAEVQQLFPEPADVQKLNELMNIVKSSASENTKVNQIVANAESFGGIVLKLLSKFA